MSENNIKKFMLIILKIKEVLDVQDILVLSEKLPGWGDLSSFFWNLPKWIYQGIGSNT